MSSSPTSRKTWACARCRRHKLKCDSNKPCTLCIRADAICQPQTLAERSRLNDKRMYRARVAGKLATIDRSINSRQKPDFSSPSSSQGQETRKAPILPSSNPNVRQRVADSSSMEFARMVIGEANLLDESGISDAPDDGTQQRLSSQDFSLLTMAMYPKTVINTAIDAYFDRVDWFIMLMHRPSFTYRTSLILERGVWAQQELCDVVLILTVAALGIKCAQQDSSWAGHRILASHSLNATAVVGTLLREIGTHFYEVLSKSQIQSFQTVMLLIIYHTYFGSFQFAWNISGIPARTAYGLGLHREKTNEKDTTIRQVGIRCWNHAIVAELFASMIYGRSSTLNHKHTHFRQVERLKDEPNLPQRSSTLSISDEGKDISIVTFHDLKFRLYSVVWEISQTFDSLHLGQSISVQDLRALLCAVETADANLQEYRSNLPLAFRSRPLENQLSNDALQSPTDTWTEGDLDSWNKLALQGIVLQVLHDSAIIFAHRPLLECRISSPGSAHALLPEVVPDSLRISVEAALRISRVDIGQFNHHLALSFLILQQFAAGVILCVPALCLPYSRMSNDAKAGVLRIISASRTFKSLNAVARHADHLLTNLYEKTIRREMDIALNSQNELQAKTLSCGVDRDTESQASQGAKAIATPDDFVNADLEGGNHDDSTMGLFDQDFGASDELTMSLLQLGSSRPDHPVDSSLNQDLDDAFSAFQQMFALNVNDDLGGVLGAGPGDFFSNQMPF